MELPFLIAEVNLGTNTHARVSDDNMIAITQTQRIKHPDREEETKTSLVKISFQELKVLARVAGAVLTE